MTADFSRKTAPLGKSVVFDFAVFLGDFATWREKRLSKRKFHAKAQRRKGSQRKN